LKTLNEKIPIHIIAGVNNNGSALIVRKDALSSGSLSGKTVAIPGFGTVQDIVLRMYAESIGVKVHLKK
jgi:NitT/TauT family transport system substrate-binding protein